MDDAARIKASTIQSNLGSRLVVYLAEFTSDAAPQLIFWGLMLVVSVEGHLAHKLLTGGRLPRCQTSGVSPALAPAPRSTTKPGSLVDESLFSVSSSNLNTTQYPPSAPRQSQTTHDTSSRPTFGVCLLSVCLATEAKPALPPIARRSPFLELATQPKQTKRSHLKPHIRPPT
jgi:hypothetical protein